MEENEIPPSPVFMTHGYVQHERNKGRGRHCARYDTYLVPEDYELLDAFAFVYDDSLHATSREDALYLKKACSTGEADVSTEDSENESCRDSDENISELQDSRLKTESISWEERKQSENSCKVRSQY